MVDSWTQRESGTPRHPGDARTDFEVDYARVIHSGAFRRLQGKTQILSLGDDDFYRSRLTHSMEVAQVAEGISQHLRATVIDEDKRVLIPAAALIQAIGLAHDIGHPPFGHGGEHALNYCMREHGGFEGNAQTLRLLSRLESFSENNGADLTRRCLLGTLKYPAMRRDVANAGLVPSLAAGPTSIAVLNLKTCKPAKACYDEDVETFSWILASISDREREDFTAVQPVEGKHADTLHKSFDCSIMDTADDIAYGVHDLEDAIALGFVGQDNFREDAGSETCGGLLEMLAERPLLQNGCGDYEELVAALFGNPASRKRAIGRLVHYFIRSVRLVENSAFTEPLLRWRAQLDPKAMPLLKALKMLIVRHVINSPRVQHLEFKGQRMVVSVFEAIASDPRRLLPVESAKLHASSDAPMRVICDYIAGFTDGALLRTYERLFSPRNGSVFDRI